MTYNLLVEDVDVDSLTYVVNENKETKKCSMTMHGPYIMAEDVNRNGRRYDRNEMINEVKRYTEDMILKNRAMGELNHPTSADVDLERACHTVTSLKQSPDNQNVWIGESKILSTPCGKIVESLIRDGVKVGVSSRSLGKLHPGSDGVNNVRDMRLVAIDCVHDPSYADAFVDGILESKQWIIDHDGKFQQTYESFEKGLATLPKRAVEDYIKESVEKFIHNLKVL